MVSDIAAVAWRACCSDLSSVSAGRTLAKLAGRYALSLLGRVEHSMRAKQQHCCQSAGQPRCPSTRVLLASARAHTSDPMCARSILL